MNDTSDFQEVWPTTPHYHRRASCASKGGNAEQVLDFFSLLTISLFSPQASAQSEKSFLTCFSCPPHKN